MIAVIVVVIAAAAATVWVLRPLSSGRNEVANEGSLLLQEADARKVSALEAILDMEGERAAGKLSQEDFEILRAQYEVEAVRALKELDALAAGTGAEDRTIEEEIARIRAGLSCARCGALKTGGTCERCNEPSV